MWEKIKENPLNINFCPRTFKRGEYSYGVLMVNPRGVKANAQKMGAKNAGAKPQRK